MKLETKTKPILIIAIFLLVVLVVLAIILSLTKKEWPFKVGPLVKKAEIAKEIYGFSATIKEIKDKTLILEAPIPLSDLSKAREKMIVKALVSEATKIRKLKFPKLAEESKEPVYPEEIEIKFEELKVGDNLDIRTAVNISENIKNNTEFEVNQIFITER